MHESQRSFSFVDTVSLKRWRPVKRSQGSNPKFPWCKAMHFFLTKIPFERKGHSGLRDLSRLLGWCLRSVFSLRNEQPFSIRTSDLLFRQYVCFPFVLLHYHLPPSGPPFTASFLFLAYHPHLHMNVIVKKWKFWRWQFPIRIWTDCGFR